MDEYFYYDTLEKGRVKKQICGIYNNGYVGQMVILDNVSFGDNPDPDKQPLSAYPLQSIFIIKNVMTPGNGLPDIEFRCNGFYILQDQKGNLINVNDPSCGASCGYLYDAQEWLDFKKLKRQVDNDEYKSHIEKLNGDISLLTSILGAPSRFDTIKELLDDIIEQRRILKVKELNK